MRSKPEELPYLVCFFHVTDFATCCRVESRKSLSSAGRDPFIVNENLWKWKCLWPIAGLSGLLHAPPGEPSPFYLGVSDIRSLDRLRKRRSRALLTRSVLFCSILFHFWEAGRPGSVFSLCVLCLLILWSFITMWSRPLLAQELESLTPPRWQRL